jgi:TolB-like protein/class 3 adenylate cyclase/Flp pilus assembly protein TadD
MTDSSDTSGYERRLVAIMFTDIVGYTSMMQKDENVAVDLIKKHRQIIENYVKKYQGDILQYYGDGSLSVFPSAIEAVKAALQIQKELTQLQIPLRMGIHLGDVKIKDEAIFGDGVNVASRIQSLGVAGSIIISDTIFNLIKNQTSIKAIPLGSFNLKNVEYAKAVYALDDEFLSVPNTTQLPKSDGTPKKNFKWIALLAIAVVILMAAYLVTDFLITGSDASILSDRSVAVLPFQNLSNDPEQEYFSDGITEDIINHLVKIEALKVKSRTTTEQYKDPSKTIPVIGQELGVSYILEGSVRKVGNLVRVVAQLIEVKNDVHVWTETYDREMDEIFDIQSEIAIEIARVLEAQLTNEERRHIRGRGREKMRSSEITAYDYLLKARNIWREWNDEQDLQNALQLIEEAIKMNPNFARAYVLKGNILHYGLREFGEPTKVWIDEALDLANKAIGMDSLLASAYLLKGNILSGQNWNSEEALNNLIKAYSLEPGNPEVLGSLGNIHLMRGHYVKGASKIIKSIERAYSIKDPEYYLRWGDIYRFIREPEKAIQLYDIAIKLAPGWLMPYYNIGQIYRYDNDLELAEEILKKGLEIAPLDQQTIDVLGWVNLQAGDLEEAAMYWSMYKEIESQFSDTSQYLPFRHRLGYILALQGDTTAAIALVKEQLTRDLERHHNLRGYGVWMERGYYYDLAASYAFLDKKQEALVWLDSAAQVGFMNSWYMQNDPMLKNIRSDAAFERIKTEFEDHQQRRIDAFKQAIEENNSPLPEIQIGAERPPS